MRRVPLITAAAIVPLLLGAATSILVAWALVVRDSLNYSEQTPAAWPAGDHGAIVRWTQANVGWTRRSYYFASLAFVDPTVIRPRFPSGGSTKPYRPAIPRAKGEPPREATFVPQSNSVSVSEYGLPFRCVHSLDWVEVNGSCLGPARVASRGLLRHHYSFDPLPVLPSWPGLLANTAIYATPWYAALFLIPQRRRQRRRNRGLCERCAYDRQGLLDSARCPECGHPPAT